MKVLPRYIAGTKRDAHGHPICKVCANPLSGRKRSYCSTLCFEINTPSVMALRVWERDHGVCAICGMSPEKFAEKFAEITRYWLRQPAYQWEADHILPVAEGGGMCGLDGMRTLCKKCHGRVSGELRKRLNERKRLEKLQRETGRLF